MGWTSSLLDKYSQLFVDAAAKAENPVADIGAAYGAATLPALKAGAKVIANDIDARHLEILKAEVPAEFVANLTLQPGAFPDAVSFDDNTLSAVLCANVFHFFDGATVDRSIKKMFNALASGGKAYVITCSPYMGGLTADMVNPYEKAFHERKAAGDTWPGFFDNVHELGGESAKKSLPPQMHFFDADTLKAAFVRAGFVVEQAELFTRAGLPDIIKRDGREYAGIIARKP